MTQPRTSIHNLFRLSAAIIMICLAFIVQGNQASAAQPTDTITISPFLSETQIQPGDVSKPITIYLSNNTRERHSFSVSTVDFGSLNETGGVAFAGANIDNFKRKYGLATWLKLPSEKLTLEAGQTSKFDAVIENNSTLGPGGHYAAVVMTVGDNSTQKGGTVTVQQKISALVFATKTGGEVYDMRLDTIEHDGSWQQLPSLLTLHFENKGNVHIVPRGTVRIIAPGGRVVSSGVINEASAYVLPETTRQIVVQPDKVSNAGWIPGTYTIQADYRYDGHEGFVTKSINFSYYNFRGLTLCFIVLVILGYSMIKYRHKVQKSSTAQPPN